MFFFNVFLLNLLGPAVGKPSVGRGVQNRSKIFIITGLTCGVLTIIAFAYSVLQHWPGRFGKSEI